MADFENPAMAAFATWLAPEKIFGDILIRSIGQDFTLCHAADASIAAGSLQVCGIDGLRTLAANTVGGEFRPLKTAPNLRRGWLTHAHGLSELEMALDHLYPGAVADWYAVNAGDPPITNFRTFVDRQTGMYRTAAMLSDANAAEAIRASCDSRVCVRRRLWTIDGLEQDPAGLKSVIPCLEPCALALELSRRAMRLEQDEKVTVRISIGDLATLAASLDLALAHPSPGVREGDSGHPANPRRILLLKEKLLPYLPLPKAEPE